MAQLSIVIPAYNEELSIAQTLQSLLPHCQTHDWQLIVVNDGSKDGTAAALKAFQGQERLQILTHPINRGYGAALKSGVRAAQTPFVGTMDSDGQHQVADFLRLYEQMGGYDLLVGARQGLIHSQLWRMPGKWLLQSMAIFLLRRAIPDLNSGMRIFRREVLLKYLHLFPDGFSFSTTSTMIFMNRGYAVEFLPITVKPRLGKSTVKLSTGFDTLLLILRLAMLLDPLRLLLPLSLGLISIGTLWTIPLLLQRLGYSIGALILLMTGLLIFAVALLSDQIAALRKERFE
jgi:glycosyltransferase involved in cell wall biosynthesis